MRNIVASALLCVLWTTTTIHAAGPQRHAVIIGINDYADPAIPALKFAESDAKAGVFTHFLVAGLRGAADTNADGVVTLEKQSTF